MNMDGFCPEQILHGAMAVSAVTDRGPARSANEDTFGLNTDIGLAIVADGIGGHGEGELASQRLVDTMLAVATEMLSGKPNETPGAPSQEATLFESGDRSPTMPNQLASPEPPSPDELLRWAVKTANEMVFQLNVDRGRVDGAGIGATMACLFWPTPQQPFFWCAHVGDCRIYRFRGNLLQRLTRDHSRFQEWLDSGMCGERPKSNLITRAIGPLPEVIPDVMVHSLLPGDVILLCSDGLFHPVTDLQIEEALRQVPDIGAEAVVSQLLQTVYERNGRDNATILIGYCHPTESGWS